MRSSASIGSEITRVAPSSSWKKAFPAWIPRTVRKPADSSVSRYLRPSHSISAVPLSPPSGPAGESFTRIEPASGSGRRAAFVRYVVQDPAGHPRRRLAPASGGEEKKKEGAERPRPPAGG